MNTAVINIKVDPKIKKQAQVVAQELGFSLSSLLNAYLRQLVRDRTVGFSDARFEPTPYLKRILKKSEEDIHAGRVVSFNNPPDALAYIDTIIADGKKHRVHRLHARVRKAAP